MLRRFIEPARLPAHPWNKGSRNVVKLRQRLQSKVNIRRFRRMLIQCFAPKEQAGGCEEERAINRRIPQSSQPDQPGNRSPVVNDQVADIKELKVRDGKVNGVNDRLQRLAQLQGQFVQMPSEQKNPHRDEQDDGPV